VYVTDTHIILAFLKIARVSKGGRENFSTFLRKEGKIMADLKSSGIKLSRSREIATKVIDLLAKEKCTVGDAHEVLRWAEELLNNSPVAVQSKN